MGKVTDALDPNLIEWIGKQHLFFVATAPRDGGHVNLSPKGLDSFRVLGPTTVSYLDLTGSGVETVSHLRDDGRITLMFCAFEGPPNIVRLFGQGRVVELGDPDFEEQAARFPAIPGARSVITVEVHRVQSSCGYAVPRMDFVEDRNTLVTWAERRGPDGLAEYRRDRNSASIDGLPGLASVQDGRH